MGETVIYDHTPPPVGATPPPPVGGTSLTSGGGLQGWWGSSVGCTNPGPAVVFIRPSVVFTGPSVVFIGPSVVVIGPSVVFIGPSAVFIGALVVFIDLATDGVCMRRSDWHSSGMPPIGHLKPPGIGNVSAGLALSTAAGTGSVEAPEGHGG